MTAPPRSSAPFGATMSDPASAIAPTPTETTAVEAVRAAFGDALLDVVTFRDETTLVVTHERIVELLRLLRDDPALGFDRLSDLTAVDYLDLGREPRFAVVYHLMSRTSLRRLRVRALVPEDDPFIDSCTGLFPSANWLEREVYDMFGIGFLGHPNLTRILMPDDWDGYPLRKDFPVGMEEVTFSFNQATKTGDRALPAAEGERRYTVAPDVSERGGEDPGSHRTGPGE